MSEADFIEVPVYEAVSFRDLNIYGDSRPSRQVHHGDGGDNQCASGTGCTTSGRAGSLDRYVVWSIGGSEGNVLSISEFSLREELRDNGLRLHFPGQLFPDACFVERFGSEDTCTILVLTTDGSVYCIDIPHPALAPKGGASVLANVSGEDIRTVDLAGELEGLEEPVAMVAGAGILCIGCYSGAILCVPLEVFDTRVVSEQGPFELRDKESILNRMGLWAGIVHKPKNNLKDLRLMAAGGHTLLFAVHEDCALRVWSIGDGAGALALRKLLSFGPGGEEGATPCVPTLMQVEEAAGADKEHAYARRRMVLHYHPQGALPQEGALAVYTVGMRAQQGGGLDVAVDFEATVRSSLGEGRVVDVRLVRDVLWLLQDMGTSAAVSVTQLGDGGALGALGVRAQRPCRLLDDALPHLGGAMGPAASSTDTDFARAFLAGPLAPSGRAGPSLFELPASRVLCGQLMGAGCFSRRALRHMLRGAGRPLSQEEAEGLTLEGLEDEVVEAARAELGGGGLDGGEGLVRWGRLLRNYHASWREVHCPLGLLTDPTTGAVGVVRAGLVTLMRPCDYVEAAHGPAAAAAAAFPPEDVLAAPPPPGDGATADLHRVIHCAEAVGAQLGGLAAEAFQTWALGGADVAADALPFLVRLLEAGAPPPGDQSIDDVEWEHRAERRRRLRMFHVKLAEALRAVGDLPAAVGAYAELLAGWGGAGGEGGGIGGLASALAVGHGVRQMAASRLDGARNLAVLVAYVGRMKGMTGLRPDTVRRTSAALTGVVAALRWAHLIHWLGSTFAAVPTRLGRDPSAAMSALNITDGPAGAGGGMREAAGGELGRASDSTLAQLLYPTYRGGCGPAPPCGGSEALAVEAARFSEYLRAGGAEGAVWGADALELEGRVLDLGAQLFAHSQFEMLDVLLLQASASVSFLRGLCACAGMQRAARAEDRAALMDDAVAHFFRAASGLRAASGPTPGHLPRLHELLVTLQRMVGVEPGGLGAAGELQYFEALMLVFERLGCSEGAYRFAHAAVRLVDVAYEGGESGRKEREGRLWANMFKYAMDAGRYSDAYAAIISNPIDERSLEGIRALVPSLCENGAVGVLCSLPLVGGMEVKEGGVARRRLLIEEAEAVLERRADASEVRAFPSPYKVLYAFYTNRSNHASAAAAMVRFSERLRADPGAETEPVLAERAAALSAAVNSLELVDSRMAFVEEPSAGAWAGGQSRAESGRESPAKRPRYIDGGADAGGGGRIIPLAELRKQAAVAAAVLEVARLEGPSRATPSQPNTAAHAADQLLSAGRYHSAFSLLATAFEGGVLTRRLSEAFRAMAQRCVALQLQEAEGAPLGGAPESPLGEELLGTSGLGLEFGGGPGGRTAAAWRQLQAYLAIYDTPERNFSLRVVVADTILATDRRMTLPGWLVRMFQGRMGAAAGGSVGVGGGMAAAGADPAALVRLYMRYGMDAEAAAFAADQIGLWAPRLSALELERHAAVWLPYGLLSALMGRLRAVGASAAGEELERAVQGHLGRAAGAAGAIMA